MKALPDWKNLDSRTKKHWSAPFTVRYMEDLRTLDQPAANDECGFYVMWAMLVYFGANPKHGDEMVCRLPLFYCVCLTFVHLNIILP